ncbi:MAG: SDR family NAD(P)-dependent oxidoreductase [Ilumatobacter sp.]
MTVVVTGAGNGLGRSLALACRARGDAVLAVDCDDEALTCLEGVTSVDVDLLAVGAVDHIRNALTEPCSEIHHVAGISGTGRFEEIPPDHHERVLTLNFEVPMQITCALLAAGAFAPTARHVFIASLSRFTSYPGATSYAASKDGIASFARSLDAALPERMSAHCVFPGPLRTAHAARYSPDNSAAKVRRRQDPDDAAAAILRQLARGRTRIFPNAAARGFAAAGVLAPGLVGGALRRSLFENFSAPQL